MKGPLKKFKQNSAFKIVVRIYLSYFILKFYEINNFSVNNLFIFCIKKEKKLVSLIHRHSFIEKLNAIYILRCQIHMKKRLTVSKGKTQRNLKVDFVEKNYPIPESKCAEK